MYLHQHRNKLVARTWPRKRGTPKSEVTKEQNDIFAATIAAIPYMAPDEHNAAHILARGTSYVYRDILFMIAHGEYVELEGLADMSIQQLLDTITTEPGAMLWRGPAGWVGLLPPSDDCVLAYDVATHMPFWTLPTDTGITELTGDVVAGPGSGVQAATLSATGVAPGAYTFASINVDSKGRLVAAADGGAATTGSLGLVKPDGTSITINGAGAISAVTGGGGLFGDLMSPVPTDAGIGFTGWMNQNGSAVNDVSTGVEITPALSHVGNSLSCRYKATSGTRYEVTGVLTCAGLGANVKQACVGFSDGTKLWIIRIVYFSGVWSVACTTYTNVTSPLANTPASQDLRGLIFAFRFGFDATNFWFDISNDGGSWLNYVTQAKSGSFLGASGFTRAIFGGHADADAAKAVLLGWHENITP